MQDKLNLFSSAQDIGQVAGTYLSTYSIQVGPTLASGSNAQDLGAAALPFTVEFDIDEALVGSGASVAFEIVTATDGALTSGLVVLATTGALAITGLTLGKRLYLDVPAGTAAKTYVGCQYVVSGATTTAGTVTAKRVIGKRAGYAPPDNVFGAAY